MCDYMGAFLFRSGFAHADNVITKRCSKTITWLFLSRLQGDKPLLNLPEPWNSPPAQTGTLRNLRNLPPEPTPAHIGILLPEPASGTYTTTHRDFPEPSGTCLRNLHQHTPEPSGTFRNLPPEPTPAHAGTLRKLHQHSGTFRNLPPEPTPAHTGTLRNLPEPSSGTYTSTHRNPPSGTCLRNLHHHTPGLSRTFRNLPPEPTPAHTGTLRNLPEPASGTYTSTRRNPAETTPALRNLPELASGTYTSTHRNPPEPSGTFLRNLHQHTPEPSGTFRNLPPEPAPATRTGTHRSLSGLKTPLAYAVGEKSQYSKEVAQTGRSSCGSVHRFFLPFKHRVDLWEHSGNCRHSLLNLSFQSHDFCGEHWIETQRPPVKVQEDTIRKCEHCELHHWAQWTMLYPAGQQVGHCSRIARRC